MSTRPIYTTHCDYCRQAWIGEEGTKKESIDKAKSFGWKRIKVTNGPSWDFCPSCIDKYEKTNGVSR